MGEQPLDQHTIHLLDKFVIEYEVTVTTPKGNPHMRLVSNSSASLFVGVLMGVWEKQSM